MLLVVLGWREALIGGLAIPLTFLGSLTTDWPDGYAYRIGGEAEKSAKTFGDMFTKLGVPLFLVFALLVIQFDSFRQPLIILASVPLALIGVFTAFFWVASPSLSQR